MFPEPCLSSLNCGSSTRARSQDPQQDPRLRTLYRRSMCPGPWPNLCLSSLDHVSGPATRFMSLEVTSATPLEDPCLRTDVPAPWLWIRFQMNQNRHSATARAIRHAGNPQKVGFANIKSAARHNETQKNGLRPNIRNAKRASPSQRFAQAKRKFWPPDTRFFAALRKENTPSTFRPRPRTSIKPAPYSYHKNPSALPHCLGNKGKLKGTGPCAATMFFKTYLPTHAATWSQERSLGAKAPRWTPASRKERGEFCKIIGCFGALAFSGG